MRDREDEKKALQLLSRIYCKILKVNLTLDEHEEIKAIPKEMHVESGYSDRTSLWLKGLVESEMIHPDDVEKYLLFSDINSLRSAFLEGKTYICCHYRRKIGNEFRWVSMELVTAPEYSHDQQIVYLYIKDIHDEFVTDIENRDFLTGAYNRRGFLKECRRFLNQADQDKKYAIVLFNIRGFKGINEYFGTEGGDEVLLTMYRYFKNSVLQPIVTARTNGDHFFCLVDQDRLDYNALPGLCRTDYARESKTIQIRFRCGIYLITDRTVAVSVMCDYAQIAIQHIFDEYIKSYAVFDASMRIHYLIRSEIQGRLQTALDNREFEVYYQPVYDAHTGEMNSAEALIRWNYPKKGIVSPGVFIPVLEESGQITLVDRFVLDEVCKFYMIRSRQGKKLVPVSINLSWMDFYDTEMMDAIFRCLQDDTLDIHPRFEVTETAYAAMSAHEADLIGALQKAGAEVLLDDFGSGCSSFSTFSTYDFDIIKLDMGFVQKIGTDDKTKSIIHSIIDMSHHMNVKVIAEGVETESQLDFLCRHDCDYIQGYYFSKPLPRDSFEELLEQGSGMENK